jgi:hypothetical protein
MAAKTKADRQAEREFSEASRTLRQRGFVAYMYARMNGTSHEDALELGITADES